ncbi:ribosome recycling factor [Candidatus Cytomitobacter primus]|uniref:Ribosome recycling factor n=1 Tax=Candidatus Cytomitobacter primus TaxID=2066024 RepID=A0A5C0UGG8_9PROT|nr:ribosome recycling factor [Candidatus Cytomitobacter primus]QEK38653.1 ribosome recycling factor [Candidatus Cytomitobacter primus]
MELINNIESNLKNRIAKSIEVFADHLKGLRTNVVSPDFLSAVKIDAHGQFMPIKSVASITVKDQTLHVQVWDKSLIKAVEKGIMDSKLNVNPSLEGDSIFIKIPPLTQERRKELVKMAKDLKEKSKISVRTIRQDSMSDLKKLEKDKAISEDARKKSEKIFEEIIKKGTAQIELLTSQKEKDIIG